METDLNSNNSGGNNRIWIIVGVVVALLCLCVLCVGVGFFVMSSDSFSGLGVVEEPTPFPTFAMPTIPPIPTSIVIPTTDAQEEQSVAPEESPLSNLRTSLDEDGFQVFSTFSAFQTVYVVGDLKGAAVGDYIVSKWYAENVEGFDLDYFIDEARLDVGLDPVDYAYFYFEPPTSGWPLGLYRVELYYNDVLTGTVNFTIE